jgi:hypothetical protein
MVGRPTGWAGRVGERVIFCSGLTIISAIPSYLVAGWTYDIGFDLWAINVGIAVYAVFWSVVACLPVTDKLLAVPFVWRTVKIGFLARLLFTVSYVPSGMFERWMGDEILDWVANMMPAGFVPVGPGCVVLFKATLVTALVDGAMNSVMLVAFMACVWAAQLVRCRQAESAKGFPVEVAEEEEERESVGSPRK